MEKGNNKAIELRSEKVRKIIGNEMPFFIRHGISIITLVLILMCLVVLFFLYPYRTIPFSSLLHQ